MLVSYTGVFALSNEFTETLRWPRLRQPNEPYWLDADVDPVSSVNAWLGLIRSWHRERYRAADLKIWSSDCEWIEHVTLCRER